MKSLWLENQQLSFRNDLPIPSPAEDGALIKVRMVGICATDLEMVRGYYPFTGIPGHEFVGEVVEAKAKPELIGKRVVGEINIGCGTCDQCLRGYRTHCRDRKALGIHDWDGAFAEYTVLPISNLYEVPDPISDQLAVFTEPLAAALEIQQQIHIQPDDRILLIGAGRLGQLIAQSLAICPCDLRVVTRHTNQKEILEARGIKVIAEEDVPVGDIDVVIEATGSPKGFTLARKAVKLRGTLVLKSTYKGDLSLNLSSIVVDEITLVGSRCGPFPPAIRLLAAGLIDPQPMINSIYDLENGLEAFETAGKAGVLKVLIQP